ncbi:MAG: DNA polymerase III subunit delta', partial [Chlorobiales bacterium]|nr:DNA polymerase III subunit delta' [Chlorobiales bacterium]
KSCKQISEFKHPNIEFIFPIEKILLEKISETGTERGRQEEALARMKALYEEKQRNPYFTMRMDKSMGILKDQVLLLIEKSSFKPAGNKMRVYILSQADTMNDAAANKLLKLLEEPPPFVLFILVSSRPENLLPTIVSRCQPLRFSSLDPSDIQDFLQRQSFILDKGLTAFISSYSRGNLNHVLSMAAQISDSHEKPALQQIRDEALEFLRYLLSKDRGLDVIRKIEGLTKRDQSRDDQRQLLLSILLILQDVVRYHSAESKATLINADIPEVIERFAKNFPNSDFEGAANETERAIYAISRNANALLTFTALGIKLKSFLKR